MAQIIYGLCALTALLCSWQLLKAYHTSRYKVLLWGGLCFAGLTFNGILLVFDKVIFVTEVDLSLWRQGTALLSMMVLLYGLIWDTE